jgi:hypothetical protein
VFRYDPAEEYQPFKDKIVSYLKVVVTVVPMVNELPRGQWFEIPMLVDQLEESYPCYGALLHVTLGPTPSEANKFTKDEYPYFTDFEPKKRELYEMVTDTGEVLSGSSNKLAVGKSAMTNQTTENYNLDTGWNFSMNASYAGTGGGHSIGATGEHGGVNRNSMETTDIQNAEASTERRELQSHSTQLAQMYNLFQAFQLGTNHAMFLMEPRPHIRQAEVSFINGPRAIEGIQEVFLTVVRPKNMEDFCVGVVLETAHLSKSASVDYATKNEVFDRFRLTAKAPSKGDPDIQEGDHDGPPVTHSATYNAPAGWIIVGHDVQVLTSRRPVGAWQINPDTPAMFKIMGSVNWHYFLGGWDLFNRQFSNEDGQLDIDVVVHLRQITPTVHEPVRKLFLSATQLCCCGKQELTAVPKPPSITYEADMPAYEFYTGLANQDAFLQSRMCAAEIRREMIRSLGSSRRREIGEQTYVQSDIFLTRVADVFRAHEVSRDLSLPLNLATAVPPDVKRRLAPAFGGLAVGDVMAMDAHTLALRLDVSQQEAVHLKEKTLREIGTQLKDALSIPNSRPGASR